MRRFGECLEAKHITSSYTSSTKPTLGANIGRETSYPAIQQGLTLEIQDQYKTTQNDYHFRHQIEMEARHQQHVDRFGNRGGVIWFDTTGPTTKLDTDNNNDNNTKIPRR